MFCLLEFVNLLVFIVHLIALTNVVTMDAMQEAHSQSPSGQDAAPAPLVAKEIIFDSIKKYNKCKYKTRPSILCVTLEMSRKKRNYSAG